MRVFAGSHALFLLGSATLLAAGCGAILSSSGGAIRALALRPRHPVSGPLFTRLSPRDTGIEFREAPAGPPDAVREESGAGVAAADVDGDGRVDLFFVSRHGPDHLYRNRGGLEFEDVTRRAGVAGSDAPGSMALFADIDKDNDADLYVLAHGAANRLYLNEGRGHFREAASECGLAFTGGSRAGAFADYDRDGDLDLVLLVDPSSPAHGGRATLSTLHLLRNEGRGRFQEVTRHAGALAEMHAPGASALWWDPDGDGWPDLFVTGVPGRGDVAFRNRGDGHFVSAVDSASIGLAAGSRGIDPADVNGDGRFDLAIGGPVTRLLVNTGSAAWIDAAGIAGLDAMPGAQNLRWGDLDLDGREDLVATGAGGIGAFRARGDLGFEDSGQAWGLEVTAPADGAVLADLDRDGDLDFAVNHRGDLPSIWRNDGAKGHAIEVQLVGHASNHDAVGARITVESSAAGRQSRAIDPARGWVSFEATPAHFGLGNDSLVTRLAVTWPSGATQEFRNLAAGRLYVIEEGAAHVRRVRYAGDAETAGPAAGRFVDAGARAGLDGVHAASSLGEGPGIATGDVDGDGDDDVFVGGGVGQPATLYVNDGAGHFRHGPGDAWSADAGCDDMGALFVDTEGDGDLDLYVVSGGEDCSPASHLLQDRLYLNDGHANFSAATPSMLPVETESGSVVSAADFDRDGDLDLFVGGRLVPHRPDARPRSLLLVSGRDRYHEAGERAAPGLAHAGRVTGAVWSDADGDGWIDLLVTAEDGPIRYYRNLAGELIDATAAAGLLGTRGDWRGIAAADVDADGDMDYVVTGRRTGGGVAAGAGPGDDLAGGAILVNAGDARFDARPLPRLARAAAGFGIAAGDLDGDGRMDLVPGLFLRGSGHGGPSDWEVELTGTSGIPFLPFLRGLAVIDADRNGSPDLIASTARGAPRLLLAVSSTSGGARRAVIRLRGTRGNPLAIGARVRATTARGRHHLAEIHAGAGYLSQSSPVVSFGLEPGDALSALEIRWPDGSIERLRAEGDSVTVDASRRKDV